jgi:dUTP pyrophosphatase
MVVEIINKGKHEVPSYSTELSAGMDIKANIDESYELKPFERHMFRTGIYLGIPDGYECQVRPRSGLALKYGITVLNTPGTIDADYRGEICVILVNLSDTPFTVHDGDRIAQIVFSKYEKCSLKTVDQLSETDRGSGGFGHTGI